MSASVHNAYGLLLEVCRKLHVASKHLTSKKLGFYDPEFTVLSFCFVDCSSFTLMIREFVSENVCILLPISVFLYQNQVSVSIAKTKQNTEPLNVFSD